MSEGVILIPCIEMLRKVVCGQRAMILFCVMKQNFKRVKYLCNSFITLLSVEYNSLFGCNIVSKFLLYCLLCVHSAL